MKQSNQKSNNQNSGPSKQKNRSPKGRRRRRKPSQKSGERPKSATNESAPPPEPPKAIPKRYGIVFYDTHAQAKEDSANLLEKAREVDQLNIVVRAEGTMDDPELLQYGKLYAGEAWATIHQRRVDEGWYNEPH